MIALAFKAFFAQRFQSCRVLFGLVFSMFILSGCVTVQLDVEKPQKPVNYSQAVRYLDQEEQLTMALNQALNQQERACYSRFLVSDCVDSVRERKADYRRAHIEAGVAANNIIRLQRYKERLIKKSQ